MPRVLLLKPDQIDAGWRARDAHGVNELAKNIADNGQIQPVAVVKNGRGYKLLAGARRLAACTLLKRNVMAVCFDSSVDRELALRAQGAENFQREDFDDLERGEFLAEWKREYERAYPETKHGGARKKDQVAESATCNPERFSVVAARQVGVSERKIYELLEVAALPKRAKAQAVKAPSRAKRNYAVRSLITQVRSDRRDKALAERAAKAKAEREKTAQAADEPLPKAKIVLRHQDNRDFFKTTKRASFDVLLSDPEYDLDWAKIQFASRATMNSTVAWDKLDLGWIAAATPLMRKDATIGVFCPAEMIGFYKLALQASGWEYRGHVAWHKTNPQPLVRNGIFNSTMEYFVFATRGKPYFKPFDNKGAREAHNFIEGPTCGGSERVGHPTQKPIWLVSQMYERLALPEHRVLDPFCGVGTTLVVAKIRDGEAVGVELEENYVRQAKLRLEAMG